MSVQQYSRHVLSTMLHFPGTKYYNDLDTLTILKTWTLHMPQVRMQCLPPNDIGLLCAGPSISTNAVGPNPQSVEGESKDGGQVEERANTMKSAERLVQSLHLI